MKVDWWIRSHVASLSPSREEVDALTSRVRASRAGRRRPWPMVAGAVAAAAGVALLAVGVPRSRPLSDVGAWMPLGSDVVAWPSGTGSWRGRTVTWDEGTLRLSVTPERGVDLRILTPEAAVRVVGTVFSVDRDATGTTVAVERGRVDVACADGSAVLLDAAERHTCLRSAAAGLGLALRLEQEGAPVFDWLAVVASARRHEATPQVRAGLIALEADGLLALGRVDDAVRLVDAPEIPDPALAGIARAVLERDGCGSARGLLERLHDHGDGVASVLLADCTPDPTVRMRILDQALARNPDPDITAAIAARRSR